MPINPGMLLGVRPPEIPDPLAAQERAMRLRDLTQARDYRQMQMDQARREIDDAAQKRLLSDRLQGAVVMGDDGQVDRKTSTMNLRDLTRMGAVPAPAAAAMLSEWDAADRQVEMGKLNKQKLELDNQNTKVDLAHKSVADMLAVLESATDQGTWTAALERAQREKWMTPEEAEQYTTFDTNALNYRNQQRALALGAKGQLDQRRQEIDDQYKRINEQLSMVGRMAPGLTAEGYQTLRSSDLLSPNLKALLPETFDPKSTPALLESLGRTPAERAAQERGQATADRQAMPNTPTDLAVIAADPKRPPEERARAESALRRLNQYTEANRAPTADKAAAASAADKRKRFDALQKEHDKIFASENKIHAEIESAGQELNTITLQLEALAEAEDGVDSVAYRQLEARRRALQAKVPGDRKRIGALQRQRATVQQRKDRVYSGASAAPAAGAARQQSSVQVKTPDGRTYTFPDQAAANAFKREAGIP